MLEDGATISIPKAPAREIARVVQRPSGMRPGLGALVLRPARRGLPPEMKTVSGRLGLVGEREQVLDALVLGMKERRGIVGVPLVLLARDDEAVDVGFAIHASQP